MRYALPALLALALCAPAFAETPDQLDAESRATDREATGLALARKQIAAGQVIDALASLERLLANFPRNNEARALHAGVMCRLDDRRGALLEFDDMRTLPVSDAVKLEARAPCSGTSR